MVIQTIPHFDIAQICESGQCFRMTQLSEHKYEVIASDRYLEVTQQGEQCTFSCSEDEFETFWKSYFDLDTDYGGMQAAIDPKDRYLSGAAKRGSGIRILRQDLWEMIISFLISQQNNIVRIRRCIQNICEKYGEKKVTEQGREYSVEAVKRSVH